MRRIIQILLSIMLLTLALATAANSQTPTPTSGDDSAPRSRPTRDAGDCIQALDKALDALEKETAAKLALIRQSEVASDLLAKERAYNDELLKAVALLTSAEKRNKSFFRKLIDQLGRTLKAATRPEALITLAGLIVVLRNR